MTRQQQQQFEDEAIRLRAATANQARTIESLTQQAKGLRHRVEGTEALLRRAQLLLVGPCTVGDLGCGDDPCVCRYPLHVMDAAVEQKSWAPFDAWDRLQDRPLPDELDALLDYDPGLLARAVAAIEARLPDLCWVCKKEPPVWFPPSSVCSPRCHGCMTMAATRGRRGWIHARALVADLAAAITRVAPPPEA